MRIEYDNQADALYILLSDAQPHHGIDVEGASGVSIDVDEAGVIVGIEILKASRVLKSEKQDLTVEATLSLALR